MSEIEYGVLGDFPYSIVEHDQLGHLCGYVAVPPSHPWYGKDYNDVDADVHGGLTYGSVKDADATYPHPLGTPATWFGFDCAHSGDLSPSMGHAFAGDVFRDRDYVFHEIEGLVQQAAAATVTHASS